MNSLTRCLNKARGAILLGCCVVLLSAAVNARAEGDAPPLLFGPRMAFSPIPPSGLRIAIFPVQNLSGVPAPLRKINVELAAAVERTGAQLVPNAEVEQFIERHWVRQLGSVDGTIASLLASELRADAVLLSNIEIFSDQELPRFALIARLVETTELPRILWMESAALISDENPGLLGLGIVTDPDQVRARVIEQICSSLQKYVSDPPVRRQLPLASEIRESKTFTFQDLVSQMGAQRPLITDAPATSSRGTLKAGDKAKQPVQEALKKLKSLGGLFLPSYSPMAWYSSIKSQENVRRVIAIIPFLNHSTRKNAAELLELHLAKHLVQEGSFNVLEVGVVRDSMLKMHIILEGGISVPAIDALAYTLKIDLILHGKVFDYTETTGNGISPVVDFSLEALERDSRRILWSSHSRNRGDDGVFFYDWGRTYSAATLTDNMTRSLVKKFAEAQH